MSVTRYTRSIGRLERVVCAENLREIRRISKHILAQAILMLKDLSRSRRALITVPYAEHSHALCRQGYKTRPAITFVGC